MDAYLGEIRIFSGTYAPKDWMFCEGQLLPISRNTALFSLIGVLYGGDGKVTFALPDLRGRAPLSQGQGPGLTQRSVGEIGGEAGVALTIDEMTAHSHLAGGVPNNGGTNSPANAVWAQSSTGGRPPVPTELFASTGNVQLAPDALAPAGQGAAHNNMQPYLPLRFIICTNGNFPPRP